MVIQTPALPRLLLCKTSCTVANCLPCGGSHLGGNLCSEVDPMMASDQPVKPCVLQGEGSQARASQPEPAPQRALVAGTRHVRVLQHGKGASCRGCSLGICSHAPRLPNCCFPALASLAAGRQPQSWIFCCIAQCKLKSLLCKLLSVWGLQGFREETKLNL